MPDPTTKRSDTSIYPDRERAAIEGPVGTDDWQALTDELILFPQAEHDDLFDALQTMVEGAVEVRGVIDVEWV